MATETLADVLAAEGVVCGDAMCERHKSDGCDSCRWTRMGIAQAVRDHLTALAGAHDAVAEAIHRSDCGCEVWRSDDQEDQTYREHADAAVAAFLGCVG